MVALRIHSLSYADINVSHILTRLLTFIFLTITIVFKLVSGFALGAVLTQEGEDGEHPIVYVSRVLTPAKKNYTTTEKECLAMVWAIKKLRPYLEGYKFTMVTDHGALR